ncbi:hypothetical protein QR680_017021 [Steinernema hermaphroditum]|uniref:Uncharacterized protein n=1 Tax=Steinernema hermaphroditum TaxID=289476 RepID=A0AA39HD05_9BILA|nr:hypothetical protein QR680_017021 [Steinernema hermaphroditum]
MTCLYHSSQESKHILESMLRRDAELFERKRKAEYAQKSQLSPEKRMVKRIEMDSDFVLTVQVQLADHVNLLKMKTEMAEFDSVHAIRKDLDVQFQFGDLSMKRGPPEKPRPAGYTNVTIKGTLQNIESARARLQNLMPITITLPLEPCKLKKDYSEHELYETLSAIRRGEEYAFPTITVKVGRGPNLQAPGAEETPHRGRPSSSLNSKIRFFLILTGAVGDSENIVQCVTKLRNYFYKQDAVDKQSDVMVGSMIDIPPEMRGYVVGKPDGIFMRFLSTISNTLIHFPSSAEAWPYFAGSTYEMPKQCRSTTYYFSGKVENVIKCFRVFHETLPVSLKFNVEELHLIEKVRETAPKSETELLNHFDSSWNLHVVMRKNVLGGEQIYEHDVKRYTGILSTTQANITRMYTYRRAIMNTPFKGAKVSANDFLKFPGGQALKQFISMNTKYGFMYSMKPDITGPPIYSVCTLPQAKETA